MDITELLTLTQRNKASDLHLTVGKAPRMRIHGEMVSMQNAPEMTSDLVKSMLYSIMTEQQRTTFERELETDFAISIGDDIRFRINAFNTLDGPAAVFRSIPGKIFSLAELGAPKIFAELTKKQKGLILVTGPTGSGKSTTLSAMINHINENEKKHIITIEDPIEFVYKSKNSLVNQREVGANTKSFARALKSALREDPDVILVGEMRDLETIQLALTAAETGHLVMGTLHTSSAAKTVDRVIDVFPANEKDMIRAMFSSSIEAIITQKLIRRRDGQGRVAAHEILLGTPPVRNLIRENKVAQINSVIQMGSKFGMVSMKDAIYRLAEEGSIDHETAKAMLGINGGEEEK